MRIQRSILILSVAWCTYQNSRGDAGKCFGNFGISTIFLRTRSKATIRNSVLFYERNYRITWKVEMSLCFTTNKASRAYLMRKTKKHVAMLQTCFFDLISKFNKFPVSNNIIFSFIEFIKNFAPIRCEWIKQSRSWIKRKARFNYSTLLDWFFEWILHFMFSTLWRNFTESSFDHIYMLLKVGSCSRNLDKRHVKVQ